jgi:uncharacterized membrane protein YcaP (DUF421 family)
MEFVQELWQEAFVAGWKDAGHVLIRTGIMIAFVFVALRFMEQRSVAQLNIFSLLLVVGLGSAVGDPMFYREVSLASTMLAIAIVVAAFELVNWATTHLPRFDRWAVPRPVPLIEHGRLREGGLHEAHLTTAMLLSLVRLHGVESLAEVKTSYLEINGEVSVIPWPDPAPHADDGALASPSLPA